MSAAIEIRKMSAGYGGRKILEDIDLTVEDGCRAALAGPNGCGKTTLMRAMIGLIPYSGSIRLHGKEVREMKRREIASEAALLTQYFENAFDYTVFETVKLGGYVSDPTDEEIAGILERTGLTELKDLPVSILSGGQKQRVFLARTLAQKAPVLLLDEPMNHLDIKHISEIRELLGESAGTLVGIYHDISLARLLSDMIIFLKDGRIVHKGKSSDIDYKKVLTEVYDIDVYEYMNGISKLWT